MRVIMLFCTTKYYLTLRNIVILKHSVSYTCPINEISDLCLMNTTIPTKCDNRTTLKQRIFTDLSIRVNNIIVQLTLVHE